MPQELIISQNQLPELEQLFDETPREQLPSYEPRDVDPGMAFPHVFGFSSLIQGTAHTYFREAYDEAMRYRRRDAQAMEHDVHVQSCLEERFRGVLKLDWELEGDNKRDPTQKAVADGVSKVIRAFHWLKRLKYGMLQAIWPGRSGVQVEWEWRQMQLPTNPVASIYPGGSSAAVTKALAVARFDPVNGDKIGFTWDHCPMVRIAGQYAEQFRQIGADIVTDNLGYSLVLRGGWRNRWLVHTSRPKDPDFDEPEAADAVHGKGVRDVLFWTYFLRQTAHSAITDALDRYGLGIVIIYYTAGNAQEKTEAEQEAKRWSRKTVVLMPRQANMQGASGIEVVDAPTAGIEILLKMMEHYERLEERYLIGQSMSSGSDAEGSLGGSGRARFAENTKHDIIAGDADDLDESLTGSEREPGLVGMIQRHTYPWSWDLFRLRHVTKVPDPEADAKLKAAKQTFDMGVAFGENAIRGLTGMPEPQEGENVVSLAQQQQLKVSWHQQLHQDDPNQAVRGDSEPPKKGGDPLDGLTNDKRLSFQANGNGGVHYNFDPNQKRDEVGRWTATMTALHDHFKNGPDHMDSAREKLEAKGHTTRQIDDAMSSLFEQGHIEESHEDDEGNTHWKQTGKKPSANGITPIPASMRQQVQPTSRMQWGAQARSAHMDPEVYEPLEKDAAASQKALAAAQANPSPAYPSHFDFGSGKYTTPAPRQADVDAAHALAEKLVPTLKTPRRGFTYIPALRDAVHKQAPHLSGRALDDAIGRLRAAGKYRQIPVDDMTAHSHQNIDKMLPGVGNTLAWLEPMGEQEEEKPPEPSPEPASKPPAGKKPRGWSADQTTMFQGWVDWRTFYADQPRETEAHDTKRPGEFAPKGQVQQGDLFAGQKEQQAKDRQEDFNQIFRDMGYTDEEIKKSAEGSKERAAAVREESIAEIMGEGNATPQEQERIRAETDENREKKSKDLTLARARGGTPPTKIKPGETAIWRGGPRTTAEKEIRLKPITDVLNAMGDDKPKPKAAELPKGSVKEDTRAELMKRWAQKAKVEPVGLPAPPSGRPETASKLQGQAMPFAVATERLRARLEQLPPQAQQEHAADFAAAMDDLERLRTGANEHGEQLSHAAYIKLHGGLKDRLMKIAAKVGPPPTEEGPKKGNSQPAAPGWLFAAEVYLAVLYGGG